MRWLWLVAVGVSDVQWPLWSDGPGGPWSLSRRYEPPRDLVRSVHEALLLLLRADLVGFPLGRLSARARDLPPELRLDVVAEADGAFVAAYSLPAFRLVPEAPQVPSGATMHLPVLCPKLQPLLEPAQALFGDGDVTVVALNTCRVPQRNPGEPVAAGPVVSRFLAEHLQLPWVDSAGSPSASQLRKKCCTWVDLLQGDDNAEDEDSQQRFMTRLNHVLQGWEGARGKGQVVVTMSGGLPQLKDVTERAVAARFGDARVHLLVEPERGRSVASTLRYADRWSEREALRFQCCEALRHEDFAGAYGLARRNPNAPWSRRVLDVVGLLLELPGAGAPPSELGVLPGWLACVAQIEASACAGDVAGVVRRMGLLLESLTWALMALNDELPRRGLQVDLETRRICGPLPDPAQWSAGLLDPEPDGRHRARRLLEEWPIWLLRSSPRDLRSASKALRAITLRYIQGRGGDSVRDWRNRLSHGASAAPDLTVLQEVLLERQLCARFGAPFGANFMALDDIGALTASLCSALACPPLGLFRRELVQLLDVVSGARDPDPSPEREDLASDKVVA